MISGRQIIIHSLDLDCAGPNFGCRALAALLAKGGPLHGVTVSFDYIKYDWSDASVLSGFINSFMSSNIVVAASSEGALFEYGSDEEIKANLQVLHNTTSANTIIAGSVTHADHYGRLMNSVSRAALKLRGLHAFTACIGRGGK